MTWHYDILQIANLEELLEDDSTADGSHQFGLQSMKKTKFLFVVIGR